MIFEIKKFTVGNFFTNAYILYFPQVKKSLVIDPGSDEPHFINNLNNVDNPSFILLTHAHIDHILGLKRLRLPLYLMPQEEVVLRDPHYNLSELLDRPFSYEGEINFLKEGTNHIEGVDFVAIHTPGHTPGSCSFLFKDSLFSGDTLFRDGIGRCDLPGSDFNEIVTSLKEKLFSLPQNTKVFPGHGEPTTIGREKARPLL